MAVKPTEILSLAELQAIETYFATQSEAKAFERYCECTGDTRPRKDPARAIRTFFARPAVRGEVERRIAYNASRFDITADRVLQAVANIAFTDRTGMFLEDEDGRRQLKPFRDMTPNQRLLVNGWKRIETETGAREEIDITEPIQGLKLLMQHLGLLKTESNTTNVRALVFNVSPQIEAALLQEQVIDSSAVKNLDALDG